MTRIRLSHSSTKPARRRVGFLQRAALALVLASGIAFPLLWLLQRGYRRAYVELLTRTP
jgi:hypothetical protein